MTRGMDPGIVFVLVPNFIWIIHLHGSGSLRAVPGGAASVAVAIATAATTAAGANNTATRPGSA